MTRNTPLSAAATAAGGRATPGWIWALAGALAVATWGQLAQRPDLDGAHHLAAAVSSGALGAAGAAIVLLACGCALRPAVESHRFAHRLAAAVACAGLLVPPGLLAARRLHPANAGAPFWTVEETFAGPALAEARWRWQTSGGARLRLTGQGLLLENAPRETAAVEAAFLTQNPDRFAWLQPFGLAQRPYAERLEWRAAVAAPGPFFLVLEAWFGRARLWVQVTGYGLHVSYPDAAGVVAGHQVQHPPLGNGAAHDWTVLRDADAVTLAVDGRRLWQGASHGPLTRLQFGDTVSDDLHGGSLRLAHVRYERSLQTRP